VLQKCEQAVKKRDCGPLLAQVQRSSNAQEDGKTGKRTCGCMNFLRSCSGASAGLKWIRKALAGKASAQAAK